MNITVTISRESGDWTATARPHIKGFLAHSRLATLKRDVEKLVAAAPRTTPPKMSRSHTLMTCLTLRRTPATPTRGTPESMLRRNIWTPRPRLSGR